MLRDIDITAIESTYARYKDSSSKHKHFLHYHDAYEICFFVDVSQVNLNIFIKDSKYEIHDGDLIFINEFDVHRFIFENDINATYKRYVVNFKKNFILPNLKLAGLEEILSDLGSTQYTHTLTTMKERNELRILLNALVTIENTNLKQQSNKVKLAAYKSYLQLLLIQIWEILGKSKSENSLSKQGKLIQEVIRFIDSNFATTISLDILADTFFVDKYHLSHLFKEITDLSIMEYVQQRRIIEAQKMLKSDKHKKVIDVCLDCGFNSVQHFHRVFKNLTGTTPHKYRK